MYMYMCVYVYSYMYIYIYIYIYTYICMYGPCASRAYDPEAAAERLRGWRTTLYYAML